VIANISMNYTGKRERTEEKTWSGETLVYRDQREPVDERWLLNASLAFRNIFCKGLDFQISGFNLLDVDHRDPDVNGNIANDLPRPGRTISGRITYRFCD